MQTQLVNFTIPRILLTKVDLLAKKQAQSRAEFIREAIREYLSQQASEERDFDLIRNAAARNNLSEKEAFELVEKIRNELPMNK